MTAALLVRAQEKPDPTNYETIKRSLSLRIYPKELVDAHGGADPLVTRVDLEQTYTVLMFDFPGGFTPVTSGMFREWHKNVAEVFQAAQANVDSANVARVSKSFALQDSAVEVNMLVEKDYAASYALDLGHNAPDLVGEWGCVVAMPFKGLVAVYKIDKGDRLSWTRFIRLTQPFIEKSYQEEPQPISDQYFWYYRGKFTRIGTYVENGVYHVAPPQGLAELLVQDQP
jgi:peroxiredoxin